MGAYLPAFDVVRVTAQGFRVAVTTGNVVLYNVTQAASPSVSTRAISSNGIVAEGVISDAAAGDVIRISHGTYPETCHFVVTATQGEAYTHPSNAAVTYVAENLVSTSTADYAEVVLTDDDNPDLAPIVLGVAKAGATTRFPVEVNRDTNYTVSLVPVDENKQSKGYDLLNAESDQITIPGTGGTGAGDVDGPASSTDNAIVRYDGTTGKLIQNSVATLADTTGIISGSQGINIAGSTSGAIALRAAAVAGSNTLTLPAGTTDFSATGEAKGLVRQHSAGGAFTVDNFHGDDWTQNLKTFYLEGAYGHTNAGLASAITAISTTRAKLVVTEDLSVTSSQTIPATCILAVENNARITVSGGATLTIGKFQDPGNVQCFAGVDASNHVVFSAGAVPKHNMAWYLGSDSSVVSDATHAVNDIITSVNNSDGGTMFVPAGSWKVNDITCPNYFNIEGVSQPIDDTSGNASCFIPKDGSTSYLFRLTGNFRNFTASHVGFSAQTNTTTSPFLITGSSGSSGFGATFTHCLFHADGTTSYPLLNADTTDQAYEVMRANVYNCQFIGVDNSKCAYIDSVNTMFSFRDCSFIVGKGTSYGIDAFNAGLLVSNCDFRGQQADFNDASGTLATLTCSITSGSATLTTTGAFTKAMEGQRVYHASALPSGRYIKSVDSATSATLSGTASASITAQSVTVYKWGNNSNRSGTAIRVASGALLVSEIDNCADEAFNYFVEVIGGSYDTPVRITNNKIQSKVLVSNSSTLFFNGNECYSNLFEVASGQVCHVFGSNTVWDNTVEQVFANPLTEAKMGGPNVIGELYIHDAQFGSNAAGAHQIDQSRFWKENFVTDTSALSRPILGAFTTYEATADSQQILFSVGVRDAASHQKKYALTLDRAVEDPYAGYYRWKSTQGAPYNGMIFDFPIGYAGNVRGTVTQGTSRTTGVTCNAAHGIITCYSYAGTQLQPGETISFTLTNSYIQNSDHFHVEVIDGASLPTKTIAWCSDWGGNAATICVKNTSLTTNETSSALKLKFRLEKDGGQLGITV